VVPAYAEISVIDIFSVHGPDFPSRNPYGVAITSDGNVFVADAGNDDVRIFDSKGNFISKFGSACHLDPNTPYGTTRIDKTVLCIDPDGDGPLEIGDGQFDRHYGIAVDKNDLFFDADTDNHRIQIFDKNGNFLKKFGTYCNMNTGDACIDPDGDGPLEIGDGQMYYPYSLRVDNYGNVVVADRDNHRIQIFDKNGNFLKKFGTLGDSDGEFSAPYDVAINSKDEIIVADAFNRRIQVFDSEGKFLYKFGEAGKNNSQFNVPFSVAVDKEDFLYVSDIYNHRIQVFDSQGNYMTKFGFLGSGDGYLNSPRQVNTDNNGNVYVVDRQNHRIQVFKVNFDSPISIKFNDTLYNKNEKVNIAAEISSNKKIEQANLEIKDLFGNSLISEKIKLNNNKFDYEYLIPSNDDLGSYTVFVNAKINNEMISNSQTIFLNGSISSIPTYLEIQNSQKSFIDKIIDQIKSIIKELLSNF
jgi:hypothetical protein